MRDEVPGEHERAADLDQRPEIENEIGARAQETESEDRASRRARAQVDLPQPGRKLTCLGHRQNDARGTEQVAQDLRERGKDRRREDDPGAPLPHRLLGRREQRRVLPTDLVCTEHPDGDCGGTDEHHRGDRDAAADGDRNGSPRLPDLAGHDRHPHEAVPRPKEDGRPGGHTEQSLVAEDGHKMARIDRV